MTMLFSLITKFVCKDVVRLLPLVYYSGFFSEFMQLSENLHDRLVVLIQPTLDDLGIELIDLDLKRESNNHILDVVIDKEGGVTLDDCSAVSSKISLILDVEDPFPFEYHLEVGSPGVYRELTKEKDFIRYKNSQVKVVFKGAYKGRKKFVGILKEYHHPSSVTLEGEKQEITVDLDHIRKIHLFPEM